MPIQMTWVVLTESAAARGIRVGRGGIEGTSSKTAKKAAEELEVETSPAEIEIATETETGTGVCVLCEYGVRCRKGVWFCHVR